MRLLSPLIWVFIAILGAGAFAYLALQHDEKISAAWLLTAAVCSYAVAYRFYSRFIARSIFALDNARLTPAVRLEDGLDFVPTNRWVVFGHHFAAIAGAGPLVGPIMAAQFGFLPGTIWIIVGAVLAGAVQDFVILIGSLRNDGKSLGAMAKDLIGPTAGWVAMYAVLMIIVILIAVLALVVVGALNDSPWGTVSIGLTIPIALLMGLWMRVLRPGKVLEASLIGVVLLLGALWVGAWASADPHLAQMFRLTKLQLSGWLIAYGFLASVLPVWVLLAPRDYLSAFVKVGTVLLLALGIFLVLPTLEMPALTSSMKAFASGGPLGDGKAPVVAGTLFPFAFITIACGAISGFHALVSSGTTPKLITREQDATAIGYGSMLMESFVAILAMIAACVLTPGIYFAINSPAGLVGTDIQHVANTVSSWGFQVSAEDLKSLAASIKEDHVNSRTGGAPTLAIGMATIFSQATRAFGGASAAATAGWYHFAIMFEALFILTTIDAGTRVGRFLFQDLANHIYTPRSRVATLGMTWLASAAVVAGWAYFLISGVTDPLGGINMLWPLFGIANQLLAAIGLCVATVLIVRQGKAAWAWITVAPLAWLIVVTEYAGWEKVFDPSPLVGFLAKSQMITTKLSAGLLPAGAKSIEQARHMQINAWVDAILCLIFMVVILVILVCTLATCVTVLRAGQTGVPARGSGSHGTLKPSARGTP